MNILEWAFGKQMTPQERLRANQRSLNKITRELDKQVVTLQKQQSKLTGDIKKSAKAGQVSAAKTQAKDLVRTRKNIEKYQNMKYKIQAISLRLTSLKTQDGMMTAMRDASRVLAGMNQNLALPQLQKISMEFNKQNDILDQKQEVMDDLMEGLDDDEEDEEEVDEIVSKVLDEIGVDLNAKLTDAPARELASEEPQRVAVGMGTGGGDDDLQARLNSLKR